MGNYLNPGNSLFEQALKKEIYVDKTRLISKVWEHASRQNPYLCVSRPRRFGKSTDANMLAAFFSSGCDSRGLFDGLLISDWENYAGNLNRHTVIQLNIQQFLSASENVCEMISLMEEEIGAELEETFGVSAKNRRLPFLLGKIFGKTKEKFLFIVDEWDCIFREYKGDGGSQKKYLDYLRLLFKDQPYIELVYMTGILPIKKYGTHSALNMFDEISMIDAWDFSEFMGFTEAEVKELCRKYNVDEICMRDWYDGYRMTNGIRTCSPRSVTAAISRRSFSNYWSQTETYEALKVYIDLNYDGLKDDVIRALAGEKIPVNIRTFQNGMDSFKSKDDVLTLLIHLGYLGYCQETSEVYIPNNEVKDTFIDSVKISGWDYIAGVFQNSRNLLQATWNMQEELVAEYIENSHYETSILQYNDENALSYTVSLAYIAAKEYYTVVRELPAGKGFADLAFIPKADKPAMLIELKFEKGAESGLRQIKEKKYYLGLENYLDRLLLVAIDYDKKTKKHTCVIERYCP